MGYSLENHLEAVFRAFDIEHVQGAVTENNQRPDFLFPSADAYRTPPATGSPHLTMLGAKSTRKDRWRQVLAEAAKIPRKHLLTLEPGISGAQTDQMEASDLQLVVPQPIQESYTRRTASASPPAHMSRARSERSSRPSASPSRRTGANTKPDRPQNQPNVVGTPADAGVTPCSIKYF